MDLCSVSGAEHRTTVIVDGRTNGQCSSSSPSSDDRPYDKHRCRSWTTCFHKVRWCYSTQCLRWLGASAFRLALMMQHSALLLVLCASIVFRIAEACSSRSTPRPRPPTPTLRPNITFQTYACPEAYAKWYCLNGATCFSVKIGESILYNCECADGYVGQRCEFKDLEGSYLASRQQVMIETASIAGGVTLLILIAVIVSVAVYVHYKRKRKERLHPQPSQSYQPFGGFRESENNGKSRHCRTSSADPESGRTCHGDASQPVGSSHQQQHHHHSAANRTRTLQ